MKIGDYDTDDMILMYEKHIPLWSAYPRFHPPQPTFLIRRIYATIDYQFFEMITRDNVSIVSPTTKTHLETLVKIDDYDMIFHYSEKKDDDAVQGRRRMA